MKLLYPIAVLLFLIPSQADAQVYLGDDTKFFNKKAQLYQRWLDDKGLGEALKLDKIQLSKNGMELELFLRLRTTDPDTAAALWRGMQTQLDGAETLEASLYHTFARFMEIPPAQGNVQVYIPAKDGPGYNPCFYVWIWKEGRQIQTDSRIDNCKAQTLNIPVKIPKVELAEEEMGVRLNTKKSRREAFEAILRYARQRYEKPKEGCEEREPRVEELDINNEYVLTFTVSDLCREVLTDERQSRWCDFVELWWGDCNDMRRERLEFTFHYTPTDEGYLLTGSLTGKFGSGVYKPRVSGYMDMEPDFEDDFLVPYVRRFQQGLKRYLEKP